MDGQIAGVNARARDESQMRLTIHRKFIIYLQKIQNLLKEKT